MRILKDGISCDDDKDYDNNLAETAAKVDAHSQEPWTAFHFRIRELGRKLRAASRRGQAQAEECTLAELQEAAQQGAKAKVHRLCVQLARNGRGVKGRRYTHMAAASHSLEEARNWLESLAVEGWMSAKILPDFDSKVRKALACFDSLACRSEQGGGCSERLAGHIAHPKKIDKRESHAQSGVSQRSCLSWLWIHCTLQCETRLHMDLALTRESVLS